MSDGLYRAVGLLPRTLILALAATSCATSAGPVASDPPAAAGSPQLAREQPTPPPEVSDALLPPLDLGARVAGRDAEPRFDVSVTKVPARTFFLSLVEGTGYDMIVHPGVEGELSLSLRDSSVDDVMQAVQNVYGFSYRRTRRGFEVLPSGLQTRIFTLNYPNLVRSGSSHTRVSSGQVSESSSNSAGADSSGGNSESISGTRIQTRSEVDVWQELRRSLQLIVGNGEGRSVVVSAQTATAIVRAMPDELRTVASFLERAEAVLKRQVILEARILEVELNDGFQAGINWAQLVTHGNKSGLIGQTGGGSAINNGTSESAGETGDLDPRLIGELLAGTAASAFGGVFSLAITASKFSAFVELLESQGDVRTLSSPRISTVNNQKAVIKVGSDEFFVTDVSTTTVTGTTTTTNPDITLTPFFSGIALDVTPQIDDDGNVLLHVHPSVSEVTDQTKQITVSGEIQTLPLAFSRIRESDSIVSARSGQVVVIGGLMQDTSRDDRAGTPWVSRIPLLGNLFRQTRTSSRKSELVILLRPTVVAEDTWKQSFSEASRRYRSLRDQSAWGGEVAPFGFGE